jgi:hypothetical protein
MQCQNASPGRAGHARPGPCRLVQHFLADGHGDAALSQLGVEHVRIDNAQFNSGGVQADASFAGAYGYDAYVGADAVGNSVTGFACAECGATLEAENSQTNSGNVSATARTTVGGDGRAVITGANATGNAASFYVTRPSH